MKAITPAPNLVDQVRDAVLGEIAAGRLPAGARIVQEPLARQLGVSRQPVQQALVLLRNLGVLREAPGRGLEVAPLDPEQVGQMYDLRGAIEALAARRAAECNPARAAQLGPALIEAGRRAVAGGSVSRLAAADLKVYELSGNPHIAAAMATHWVMTQRVMGEVLLHRDEAPGEIWDQHEAILSAIAAGQADRAETLARSHTARAARLMVARLSAERGG
jgi:DNA-binding GntR family transcriptional regulator